MSGSKPRPRGEAPRMTERRPGPVGLIGSMGRVARCSLLALVPVFVIPPARAESLYTIDQRFGSIEFTVGHLGLFTSHGRFTKFDATLTIDPVHPERTRIVVEVNAVSVDMPWQDGVAMLRSAVDFRRELTGFFHRELTRVNLWFAGHTGSSSSPSPFGPWWRPC